MSAKKQSKAPPEKLALYEKLISTNSQIGRKGATMPYTSMNGNMFTLLHPAGTMALRLSAESRERFLNKHKAKLFEAYGAVMKEYVAVPDSLLKNTKEMEKYFALSYEYVQTLKPKPTRKKR